MDYNPYLPGLASGLDAFQAFPSLETLSLLSNAYNVSEAANWDTSFMGH